MARGIMACSPSNKECCGSKKCSRIDQSEVSERVRIFWDLLNELDDQEETFDPTGILLRDTFEQLFDDVIFAD